MIWRHSDVRCGYFWKMSTFWMIWRHSGVDMFWKMSTFSMIWRHSDVKIFWKCLRFRWFDDILMWRFSKNIYVLDDLIRLRPWTRMIEHEVCRFLTQTWLTPVGAKGLAPVGAKRLKTKKIYENRDRIHQFVDCWRVCVVSAAAEPNPVFWRDSEIPLFPRRVQNYSDHNKKGGWRGSDQKFTYLLRRSNWEGAKPKK